VREDQDGGRSHWKKFRYANKEEKGGIAIRKGKKSGQDKAGGKLRFGGDTTSGTL